MAPSEAVLTATTAVNVDSVKGVPYRCSLSVVNNRYLMIATGYAECAVPQLDHMVLQGDTRPDFFTGDLTEDGADLSAPAGGWTASKRVTKEPWCP